MTRRGIKVEDLDFPVDNRQPNNIYNNKYADIVQDISEHPNIMSVTTTNT